MLISPSSLTLADDSITVTVTATPIFGYGIIDFTITYVNHSRIDLSWAFVGGAVNIMIRGKYGSYPADIPDEDTAPSDGYLVYYGNATSCSDTSMDFDQNPGILYYKAWGQKADGKWYLITTTGSVESKVVTLLAFMGLALALSITAYALKKALLAFAAGGAWIVFAVYCYTLSATPSTGDWDIYYAAFFLGCGMVLASILEPAIMRPRKQDMKDDIYLDDLDKYEKEWEDFSHRSRIPSLRKHRRR